MNPRPNILVFPSPEALAEHAAERIAGIMKNSVRERGVCSITLSGGESPLQIYRILGSDRFKDGIPWEAVHVFFGDERMVPPDNPQSNYGAARRELFSRISLPEKNIHRLRGELPPEEAVRLYRDELFSEFHERIPRFDCILLGVGEEGHTASLFPGSDLLREGEHPFAAAFIAKLNAWRATITVPVINRGRDVLFIVSGSRKAVIVNRILELDRPSSEFPASYVRPERGTLTWMLDAGAAGMIQPG